ncbi:MAG: D-Ala-D-Ala carboxypeptidase family metallohydrolase [Syntrophaceae bacterium]|jgi:hypothetical protein|nr:D-Ala-D-Ala carboxypeptidase family metallohydrolase [Syntrophaceae bacterium]
MFPPYFKREEFACTCCGAVEMDEGFIERLSMARGMAGVPFVITSGYRCPKRNAAVGSTSKNHTSGKAADILATDGPTRGKILRGLYLAGFKRIGIAKDFIHVDSMDAVESCWLYW